MTLPPDTTGMSTGSVAYTYTRNLGPRALYEIARDYEVAPFSSGIVGFARWSVTVRRKGGPVIGTVEASTHLGAMEQAQALAEADAQTRGAVEQPPIYGPFVRVGTGP